MIGGNTDTEHLAALYFSYLDKQDADDTFGNSKEKKYAARSMWTALKKAIEVVENIQVKHFGMKLNNALNICTSKCASSSHS
jgi:hypothetical protein